LSSGQFGYNVGAAYTHIFEKPTVELQNTYEKTDASTTPVEQRFSHDCLLGACEYMGSESYKDIKDIFGDSYTPGEGTKTKEALQKLYGADNVKGAYGEVNPLWSKQTWASGGNVLVAPNSNHAIVLNKIEQYKVTYKYRRNNSQTKYNFTYMNPATGTFQSTGMIRRYKNPTFYIK